MEELLLGIFDGLKQTYIDGGIIAVIFTILGGGFLGWIFWITAHVNTKSKK